MKKTTIPTDNQTSEQIDKMNNDLSEFFIRDIALRARSKYRFSRRRVESCETIARLARLLENFVYNLAVREAIYTAAQASS